MLSAKAPTQDCFPLLHQFSHCKIPSASQAELAAVAAALKILGNVLAHHGVGLTIHADCMLAIQATKGLFSSKACSALTDLARKDFAFARAAHSN